MTKLAILFILYISFSSSSTFPYSLDSLKGNSTSKVEGKCRLKFDGNCQYFRACLKDYIRGVYEKEKITFFYERHVSELALELNLETNGKISFINALHYIIENPHVAYDYFKGSGGKRKAKWAIKGAHDLLAAERACRHHLK